MRQAFGVRLVNFSLCCSPSEIFWNCTLSFTSAFKQRLARFVHELDLNHAARNARVRHDRVLLGLLLSARSLRAAGDCGIALQAWARWVA